MSQQQSATTTRKFVKGETGCYVVVSITENVKGFNSAQGYRYRHDIILTNDKKEFFVGEYITPEQTQNVFTQGEKACIEAMDHGVIVPVGDPSEWEFIGDNAILVSDVNGKNFTFALNHATTLAAARISSGKEVEIADVLKEADLFFEWIVNKHKRTLNIHK